MNGLVDDELRALINVKIGSPGRNNATEIAVWIDTAFNGSLVLPDAMVDSLELPQQSTAEAILADGKKVELATFGRDIEWFCLLYTSPSPRDQRGSRMPSSA